MVTIKKKSTLIWLFIALIAAFVILYNLGNNNKEKEINEIAETYYNIYDVEYPSYSLLKYIALNELSYEEVANELSKFGMTAKRVLGSATIYNGNCGEITLTILNRSNSKNFIQYLYSLQTNSKEYLRFLKADISSEKDFKGNDNRITGKINDSWQVYLDLEEPSPSIMFQRPQSK